MRSLGQGERETRNTCGFRLVYEVPVVNATRETVREGGEVSKQTLCDKCGKEATYQFHVRISSDGEKWRSLRAVYDYRCDSCAKPVIELLEVRK